MIAALAWLARRGAFYLLAAWMAMTLNFLVPRLMPGDPASLLFGRMQGELEPEAMDALKQSFGLTDEWIGIQYVRYMGSVLTGDLGISISSYPAPVIDVIAGGLFWTIFLAGGAVIIAFVLGTSLGAVAAWRRGGALDSIAPSLLALLGAFPYFWLAMAASWLLGFQLGWFPIAGIQNGWRSYLLPGLVLGSVSLAYVARLTRASVVENLRADYVRTAKAKGLTQNRVVGIHTLRNSLIPVVTYLGVDLGALLGGAIVTESIFNIPGLGNEVFSAIVRQEGTVVVGITTFLVIVYMFTTLFVDLLYAFLDPRIRYD